jgi:hypothetical protein
MVIIAPYTPYTPYTVSARRQVVHGRLYIHCISFLKTWARSGTTQNATMSIHLIGRLAPNPRLGVPQNSSRGGQYHLIIIAHIKRREREQIGDFRAGDKRHPLVQHGPRSWYDRIAPQYTAPAPDPLINCSLTERARYGQYS